jgi:hypothetical protein
VLATGFAFVPLNIVIGIFALPLTRRLCPRSAIERWCWPSGSCFTPASRTIEQRRLHPNL